ncbi:hypothetical protein PENTCL1PPCAC_28743, partial [Pristionchus entomophagus]
LLLLLILLQSVASDRLRYHLENLIDRNVSACDDFYHHVCSQKVDPKEFFIPRASKIFADAIKRFHPESVKNSPIEKGLNNVGLSENLANMLQIADRKYYGQYAELGGLSFDRTVPRKEETPQELISKYIAGTSALIDDILRMVSQSIRSDRLEKESVLFHSTLQTRIRMIEFMKTNSTYTDFHEVRKIAETLKSRMIESIGTTKWLHNRHPVFDSIREELKKRIASIQIHHDFDEIAKNITTLEKLNRDFNELCFANKR